mgnify:CR=1 FL=1
MDKLRMQTANKADENFRKLAAMFPNAVTETINENGEVVRAIDKDVLMQEISCTVVDGNEERYQFTWPDKKKSVLLANAPINKTLRPCREESVDFDTTENLYIEGDNLEVLKLLQETYLGKIKMIYIDPPYNTGNDFVYEDDFAQSTDEYLANSGQYDEDGNRMVQNTESNGRFHTDWLNMIYPRIRIAKDLLADDGVILISINSYEAENLKKICDEAYGANNFVCRFGWETKKAAQGMTTANMVVDNQESIYVYAKNINNFKFRGIDRNEANGFSNPDNDPRGLWKRQYLQRLGQGLPVRAITDPATKNVFTFETPYTQDKLERWVKENRIIFPTDPTKYPARKEFLNEYENRQQLVTALGLYATKATTEKLYEIFEGNKIFTNPKPDTLIHFIIQQCTNEGGYDIVLDFFSGSGTTAQAVMQLNAEDGGHRKFIMVQLPEATDEKSEAYKAGYKNICEIGKERIRRAGARIKEENERLKDVPLLKDEKDIQLFLSIAQNGHDAVERTKSAFERCDVSYSLDTGFRVLKCDTSNMKEVYYNPAEYEASLFSSLEDNIKEDRTPEDLLFQVMLDLGVLLSGRIEETTIAGKKVFNVEDNYLIACFDSNVTEETIKAIAKQKPYYFVMRDSSMANDSVATNFDQIFATYSPDTVRKVL